MITPENITRKQAKKLVKLLKKQTKYQILARHGFSATKPLSNIECTEYMMKHIEVTNEIRELLFDTSNLVELGKDWGLLQRLKGFI